MIDKQTFLNKGGSEIEGLLKRRELPRVLLITSVKSTISNETVISLSDGISVNWSHLPTVTQQERVALKLYGSFDLKWNQIW